MSTQLTTIKQFAEACRNLSNEQIYDLFEDEISQQLRDKIYAWSDEDVSEPVRQALNRIGREYSVLSLADY